MLFSYLQIAHETQVKAQIKLQLRDVKHNQCIVTRSLEATQKVHIDY